MRIFIDSEFIDNGHIIDLISIGLVAEDGRELYLQSCEFDPENANEWVQEHVFPQLDHCPLLRSLPLPLPPQDEMSYHRHSTWCTHPACPWRTQEQMKNEIFRFCHPTYGNGKYDTPEFWGYYSSYDYVAFCQLFGTMMDLPKGFPMYTNDLKQWCHQLGDPMLPEQEVGEHNALCDARWNHLAWKFLNERSYKGGRA